MPMSLKTQWVEGIDGSTRPLRATLTHRQLLGHRLHLNSLIRFAVAFTLILAGLIAQLSLPIDAGISSTALIVLGLVIGLYNFVVRLVIQPYRHPDKSAAAFDRLRLIMYGAIALDYLALAVAVRLLGGAHSPFLAFYLLHAILCAVMCPRREAIGFMGLAILLITAQVLGEWFGVPPFALAEADYHAGPPMNAATAISIVGVYGSLFALTGMLLISLVDWLRWDEQRLRTMNQKLHDLSQLRRDFLHVALHNLKSPIGVSMMHMDNLQNELAGPLNDEQHVWIQRCYDRLDGLLELLNDIQLLGELETEDVHARMELFDVKALVRDVQTDYADMAAAQDHSLTIEMPDGAVNLVGIRRMVREAIVNFVTNAIKYTARGGTITIRIPNAAADRQSASTGHIRIEVEDNGRGLREEDQAAVFEEFTRVKASTTSTGDDGKPIRIPGAGLGLSIVKRIAEAHGGRVGVDSEPGTGSVFYILIPGAIE